MLTRDSGSGVGADQKGLQSNGGEEELGEHSCMNTICCRVKVIYGGATLTVNLGSSTCNRMTTGSTRTHCLRKLAIGLLLERNE